MQIADHRPTILQYDGLKCFFLLFADTDEFGNICQGHLTMTGRPSTPVTIETLSEMATEADRLSFLMKASAMRNFDDVNVVYLHGVVICLSSPHLIVMEHMRYGPLLHFIRVRKIRFSISRRG